MQFFIHSGDKAQQNATAACVCLIKMHYRFITAGETSRVIVVKSSINIIYHLGSDPTAWAPIHHEPTNKYTAIRLMMKYLLPSCPTRAEISVKISVMKNAWTEWTPAHLSVDWSRIWLLSLLPSAAKTWGNESKWQQHAGARVVPRGWKTKVKHEEHRSKARI